MPRSFWLLRPDLEHPDLRIREYGAVMPKAAQQDRNGRVFALPAQVRA